MTKTPATAKKVNIRDRREWATLEEKTQPIAPATAAPVKMTNTIASKATAKRSGLRPCSLPSYLLLLLLCKIVVDILGIILQATFLD